MSGNIMLITDLSPSSRTMRKVYSILGISPTLMTGGHSAREVLIYDFV